MNKGNLVNRGNQKGNHISLVKNDSCESMLPCYRVIDISPIRKRSNGYHIYGYSVTLGVYKKGTISNLVTLKRKRNK